MVTIKDVKLSLMHYAGNLSLRPLSSSVSSSPSLSTPRCYTSLCSVLLLLLSHILLPRTLRCVCTICFKPAFNMEALQSSSSCKYINITSYPCNPYVSESRQSARPASINPVLSYCSPSQRALPGTARSSQRCTTKHTPCTLFPETCSQD